MSKHGLKIDPTSPLHAVLKEYKGQQVHFFPKYGNCGDGFISYATYKLFHAYDIKIIPHRQSDVVKDSVVFIGGGGNLIEGLYSHVADIIRAHCRDNQVVLLPHTIVGYADILRETFSNLRVFCRDRVSYDMAVANGANRDTIYLDQDMTFYLSDDHFDEFRFDGIGLMYGFREDAESSKFFELPEDNIDISRSWDGDIWTSPLFSEYATKSLFAYVSQFDTILSDRLHISIVGSFLQKRVILFPNSYFKNSAVFEHSIRPRFHRTTFGDPPETSELVSSYGLSLLPKACICDDSRASEGAMVKQEIRGGAIHRINSLFKRVWRR